MRPAATQNTCSVVCLPAAFTTSGECERELKRSSADTLNCFRFKSTGQVVQLASTPAAPRAGSASCFRSHRVTSMLFMLAKSMIANWSQSSLKFSKQHPLRPWIQNGKRKCQKTIFCERLRETVRCPAGVFVMVWPLCLQSDAWSLSQEWKTLNQTNWRD